MHSSDSCLFSRALTWVPGYQDAVQICKQYAGMKGPGTTARLDQHLFFRKLAPLVKRTLDKCERENGFM